LGVGGFEGVILDVDGTLVDSNDAHARAFSEALNVPFERVRPLIGMGSDKLLPQLIGRSDAERAEQKTKVFKERFLPHLRAFPKVPELLTALKARGLRLVVASSAGKDELDALLAVAGAAPFLEGQTDADDAENSKPNPDIVQAAVRQLKLPAARCVMIGDTPYDAEAAARAGVAFIGVLCGGWPAEALQPALAVRRDPADLLANLEDPPLPGRGRPRASGDPV
jgi:HAD superfamily hydrolase (TIGR01549 family)